MTLLRSALFVALTCSLFFCSFSHNESAELIISGGTIYTLNNNQPVVEAVAVKNGKIIFAGQKNEALKFKSKNTRLIDLKGKTMTPGFIEGGADLIWLGLGELTLDLNDVKSYNELVDKVKKAAAAAKPGQWILGRDWHQEKWENSPTDTVRGFPTHTLLSKVSPDNPVFLIHQAGHSVLVNADAMKIANVNQQSLQLMLDSLNGTGEIIMDRKGNPTGMFCERAVRIISRHIPKYTLEDRAKALERGMLIAAENGITSVNQGGSSISVSLIQRFNDEGRLKVRLYVELNGEDIGLIKEWFKNGPKIYPNQFLTIRSITLISDGPLGSRGAWLLESYSDRSDFYGIPRLSMDTIYNIAQLALQSGFQLNVSAIGDRANREVLNVYETVFNENPDLAKNHRFRIEYVQHLNPADIPRFGKLGIIPAMFAIQMSSDRPWAVDRLGEKRIKEGAYVWQSLLRSGARIVSGTGAPDEPINPIPCFYAAVTRRTLKGEPDGGYEPEQKMTREQALKSYTLDAAYSMFEEDVKGSIEIGKLADFTVFSQDLLRVDENKILETKVMMTIVGGQVVFSKE